MRVSHATPNGAAGVGAPHAAAAGLIHGDAKTLHTILIIIASLFLVEELEIPSERRLGPEICICLF